MAWVKSPPHIGACDIIFWGMMHALKVGVSRCRYGSLYSRSLLQMLHDDGIYVRPLGNIIYLMCTPCTSPKTCNGLLGKLYLNLDKFHRSQSRQDDIVAAS